jgi:uncharacterized protein YcsI (UPF0317 family)
MTTQTPHAQTIRQQARMGVLRGHTSGLAGDHVQGNLVILPQAYAQDFARFCELNPKPCPVLGMAEPGDFAFPDLGEDIDIRSDLPMYRVWRNGVLSEEVADIRHLWQDDWVSFVIGCSFSFESALMDAGIPLRHVQQGKNVPMFKTHVPTQAVGVFHGPLVVSMRPMKPAAAIEAVQITARLPRVHGAPVHIGLPHDLGIADLMRPDYGDATEVLPEELPVFWACGVTPQAVVQQAQLPMVITHAPGAMLVTDLLNHQLMSH